MLSILRCRTKKADVFSIVQGATVLYSHLMVSWGFIADVDLESEKYRYLGEIRMTLMAIIRLIKLRKYRGRIYCLPPDVAEKFAINDFSQYEGPRPKYTAPGSVSYKKWPVKADSIFQYFLASNFPWVSSDFLAAPLTKFDDGLMHVVYSEKMNRSNTLACVLDSERGMHLTFDFIEHLPVKAFVLEPLGYVPDDGNLEKIEENLDELLLDVSGERVPYAPIQVEVLPKVMNLICPEWLDYHRWSKTFEKEFAQKN
jgi:diacylglycerol kinase family enzyme